MSDREGEEDWEEEEQEEEGGGRRSKKEKRWKVDGRRRNRRWGSTQGFRSLSFESWCQ